MSSAKNFGTLVLLTGAFALSAYGPPSFAQNSSPSPDISSDARTRPYLVFLRGENHPVLKHRRIRKRPDEVILEHRLQRKARHVFNRSLKGFSADLTPAEYFQLQRDERVELIKSDDLTSGYVVTLQSTNELKANQNQGDSVINEHQLQSLAGHVFRKALKGFSARLDSHAISKLDQDPRILAIEPDTFIEKLTQDTGAGFERMGMEEFPLSAITGLDRRLNIDVAVIDTGIDLDHPDLDVFRHVGCTQDPLPGEAKECKHDDLDGDDWDGHGTLVAGILGARDNGIGVVGIAAGVRLWAVQAIGPTAARSTWSNFLAAMDYVFEHSDEIEIANCSLGSTGLVPLIATQTAVRNVVNAGVVVVAGAGNSSIPMFGRDTMWGTADDVYPAAMPEVMAVSAMDPVTNLFYAKTNYTAYAREENIVDSPGEAIDVAAPGVNILSTWKDGGYNTKTGTSTAAAHVSGLVALYMSVKGRAHNAEEVYDIRRAIIAAALPQEDWSNHSASDPDEFHEPLAMPSLSWIPPDPIEPAKIIGSRMGEHGFEVTFTTQPNSLHTVECTEDIGSGEWSTVASVEGTGEPATVIDELSTGDVTTQSIAPASRLYRVKTISLPPTAKP